MTDRELFFKYNMVPDAGREKDASLTNDLYNNNLVWPESKLHKDLLILLHGSYNCNANCIYCENGGLRKHYNGKVITKEILDLLIDKLGKDIREVTWHGGEPLTLPEELINYLEELKIKNNLSFRTTLQTNGILLTDEKIKWLKDLDIQWGTSFDGIYNDISRGENSTKAILSLLKRCPEYMGFIGVTYNATIDNLIDNYKYYKSIGVNTMQSCIIREIILDDTNPLLVPNDIAVEKVLEYTDYWIHDTDNPIRDNYLVRHISRVLGTIHTCEDSYCLGGWLIIDPDGNIGFCGHAADDGYLWNLKDIDGDFLHSKAYLSALGKQIKLEKTCSTCEWYNVCHSACMGLNYEYDNSYNTVNPRNCEYQKGLLEGIYELIKDIDLKQEDKYNPKFINILKENNYYSLTEIKEIENGKYCNS